MDATHQVDRYQPKRDRKVSFLEQTKTCQICGESIVMLPVGIIEEHRRQAPVWPEHCCPGSYNPPLEEQGDALGRYIQSLWFSTHHTLQEMRQTGTEDRRSSIDRLYGALMVEIELQTKRFMQQNREPGPLVQVPACWRTSSEA